MRIHIEDGLSSDCSIAKKAFGLMASRPHSIRKSPVVLKELYQTGLVKKPPNRTKSIFSIDVVKPEVLDQFIELLHLSFSFFLLGRTTWPRGRGEQGKRKNLEFDKREDSTHNSNLRCPTSNRAITCKLLRFCNKWFSDLINLISNHDFFVSLFSVFVSIKRYFHCNP